MASRTRVHARRIKRDYGSKRKRVKAAKRNQDRFDENQRMLQQQYTPPIF